MTLASITTQYHSYVAQRSPKAWLAANIATQIMIACDDHVDTVAAVHMSACNTLPSCGVLGQTWHGMTLLKPSMESLTTTIKYLACTVTCGDLSQACGDLMTWRWTCPNEPRWVVKGKIVFKVPKPHVNSIGTTVK